MNVTELSNGSKARVVRFSGTRQFAAKMAAMGIVPGTVIVKKSDSLLRGPIVIELGATQLAIGFLSAKNIGVELLNE
jgi:Fe2+ transport system protein FeoA